jgi:hypothetical protein
VFRLSYLVSSSKFLGFLEQDSKYHFGRSKGLLLLVKDALLNAGQNSANAFLPMRPANPQSVRTAAARFVASLSARQVLERKLLPGVEIYRA